jgi:hypothetical protein
MSYRVTLDNGTILSSLAGSTACVFLTAHNLAFIKATIEAQVPGQTAPAVDAGSWDHAILGAGGLRFVYLASTRRAPSDPIDVTLLDGGVTLDLAVVGVDVLLDDRSDGHWRRGKVTAIDNEQSDGDRLIEGYETCYQLRGDSEPAEIPTELQHFAGQAVDGDQWFGADAGSPTYRAFQTTVAACSGGDDPAGAASDLVEAVETIGAGQIVATGAPAPEARQWKAVAGDRRSRDLYAFALEGVNASGARHARPRSRCWAPGGCCSCRDVLTGRRRSSRSGRRRSFTPQAPQFLESKSVCTSQPSSMRSPLQSAKPALQVPLQPPAVQPTTSMFQPTHFAPQAPQLFGSVVGVTSRSRRPVLPLQSP